ncbi:13940_t:CDS:2 [Cetraspora pellucida]|uniref:13940_t:CDS:1 n=1 Tax=Cetraspora pellucida TaxID=1433469 RepID=A0ACA9MSB8_9GLOM|nr:13940_t:CDS:2 [Cetraspora pellucida]
MSSNKQTTTTPKTNDSNTPKTNDNNATTTSNSATTSTTNDNNPSRPIMYPQHRPIQDLTKGHLIPIVNTIIGETDMVGDDSTYDPREDDDYNVDEGRPLDNFSEENSEWCEKNDFNEYENPGLRQERLNQN